MFKNLTVVNRWQDREEIDDNPVVVIDSSAKDEFFFPSDETFKNELFETLDNDFIFPLSLLILIPLK